MKKISYAGTSDGLPVAVKAVQKLRDGGVLDLRYQFRDEAHTQRTIMQGVLRNTLETNELEELFISGNNSFCKRVRYSRPFRAIWKRKQLLDFDSFVGICEDCAYSPNRFDSEKDPRMTLIDHFCAVLLTCEEVALDENPNHKEDADFFRRLLRVISGRVGFQKLAKFGVDTDFVVHITVKLRLQDRDDADATLSMGESRRCLDTAEALFKDLGVFHSEAA